MLIPIVAWVFPPWIVYHVLRGDLVGSYNAVAKGTAIFGILVLGALVAGTVQFGVYSLLSKIFV
jgi:hypothetical protein